MKVSEIQNATLGIVRLVNGAPGKAFRLTIQDRDSQEVIWVDITQEVADLIVNKLSGGIVIPKAPM